MSGDERRCETQRICDFSRQLNPAIFAINCTLYYNTLCTHTSSQHVSMVKQQMVLLCLLCFQFQRTPLQKAERQNHHSIVQLLQKNDARPSLDQPVRYQIVSLFQFPFRQTFFQKIFFMYLLTMLNVIYYRMSFFLSCMLGTLHCFLSSLTLIL